MDLEEQENLRIVTNLVNVAAGDVRIGMGVRVVFCDLELDGEDAATLAYFEPAGP